MHWQKRTGHACRRQGWVAQTRRGRGYVKQADGDIQFVVDFDGPALRGLAADAEVEPSSAVDAQRRAARSAICPQRGHRRLAHDRALQARRRGQAGRAARAT